MFVINTFQTNFVCGLTYNFYSPWVLAKSREGWSFLRLDTQPNFLPSSDLRINILSQGRIWLEAQDSSRIYLGQFKDLLSGPGQFNNYKTCFFRERDAACTNGIAPLTPLLSQTYGNQCNEKVKVIRLLVHTDQVKLLQKKKHILK